MKNASCFFVALLSIGTVGFIIWMKPPSDAPHSAAKAVLVMQPTATHTVTSTPTSEQKYPALTVPTNTTGSFEPCATTCQVTQLLDSSLSADQFQQRISQLIQQNDALAAEILLEAALILSKAIRLDSEKFDATLQALSQLTQPQASLFLAQQSIKHDELHSQNSDQQAIYQAIKQAVHHTKDRVTIGQQLYQQYLKSNDTTTKQRVLDLGQADVLAQAWSDSRQLPEALRQNDDISKYIAQSNDPHMIDMFFKLNSHSQSGYTHDDQGELHGLATNWVSENATDDVFFKIHEYVGQVDSPAQQQFLVRLLQSSTSPLALKTLEKLSTDTTQDSSVTGL